MGITEKAPLLGRVIDLAYTMILVILISAIIGLVLAFPVQALWNYVFGDLYRINVFQAWALNVLASILFGKTANGKR